MLVKAQKNNHNSSNSYYFDDLDERKLDYIFSQKRNVEFYGISSMDAAVGRIEHSIEKQRFMCRIRTSNRTASLAVAAIPNPITAAIAVGTAIGIATHNLATYDPDFEVIKDYINNKIIVIYKKL